MPMFFHALRQRAQELDATFEKLLSGLVTYAVPGLLFLLSLVALLTLDPAYPQVQGTPLAFQIVRDEAGDMSVTQALARLEEQVNTPYLDTRLAEHPFWITFRLPDHLNDKTQSSLFVFPSRHASEIRCWSAQTRRELGYANRERGQGLISPMNAGFSLSVQGLQNEQQFVCRSTYVGPARISVTQMRESHLLDAVSNFHPDAGLLEGGLLILALFVLITAIVNRESTYLLFSAWLVLNLRLGALSAGWDTHWLGHDIPADWLPRLRQLTTASYYVLTLGLFGALFQEDLPKTGYRWLFRIAQWTTIPLLLLASTLSFQSYLPFLWVATIFSIGVLVFLLIRILVITRSTVAMWYIASIAVTLFASLYEVIAAALGAKELIGSINSVTAALASSLLASLAIAEQMRQEHLARLAAQDQLQHTYDAMPIGMFTLDLQGRFTNINPALRRMLGPRAFKTYQHTWQQYFGVDCWHQLLDLVQFSDDGEMEFRSQIDITGADGMRRYLVKATLAGDKIEGSMQDVTEKSVAADELIFLADNDALTKVLNRRGIEKVFNEMLAQVNDDRPMAFAYLDLDRFKLINELYGHNVGDDVLRQFCQRVNNLLSEHMRLGRVGGDQFVILMPDTRVPLANVICRGIVSGIDERPFRVGDKAFHVRVSIGLIEVTRGSQLREVVSTADHACREAKNGQHKGLVVYEKDTPAFREHQEEIRLIGEISASEVIDRLYLEVQPIMSLTRPNDALNFEVLLRMLDTEGKPVPIGRLLSAAEHSGRMSMIDRWVLTKTIAWLDQNRPLLQRTQFVCVNLSGASLNDEEFMQEVFDILRRNSHVSSFLSIEITESVALHDLQNTRRFIDRVRTYGARVALDDFGAGYTSFSYLKELPADLLKIDGNFVVNMNHHPANLSIVEAIVNLARNLGMKTVAEWAEDAATVQALAEIGVDYVQGYAIARPMALEKMLEGNSAASFIKNADLQRLVAAIDRQNNPLTQLDLLHDSDKQAPPKIH